MEAKILKKISRRYTLDDPLVKEFCEIDKIVNMEWELPSSLDKKDWKVKFVSPSGHDAEKISCNIFDTWRPKYDILPFGPEEDDLANDLEAFLEWHMQKANTLGEVEPFRELMRYSVRYGRVCAQMEYLPYWLPKDKSKWTEEQKRTAGKNPFCIYVHDPKNVHWEMGSFGPRWVASVSVVPAATVIDYWEAYQDKGIKAAIAKVEKLLDDDEEAQVVLVDYTDPKKRYVCCWLTQNSTVDFDIFDENGKAKDVIEIVNSENKLGFVNWAVAVGSSDPLLSGVHRGNLWTNANLTESIKRSSAYRRAFYPLGIHVSTNGEPVDIDYTGNEPTVELNAGQEQYTPIPQAPALDPAFMQLSAEDSALMGQSTSIQTLSTVTPQANVQYATVKAFLDISMMALEPYKRTVEKVLTNLGEMVFLWLKVSGNSETASRGYTKNSNMTRGQKIVVDPDAFDFETLHITVSLIAKTATDMASEVNMAVQLKQAGAPIPWAEMIEKLGYGNSDALIGRNEKEQVRMAALMNFLKAQDPAFQMQVQQMQMQAQMQADQARQAAGEAQQEPLQQGPGTPPIIPGGQGYNPAMGGEPSAMGAPEMTQTQVSQ